MYLLNPVVTGLILLWVVFVQLLVWAAFALWLVLYRYPLFEMLLPHAKQTLLASNPNVYTQVLDTTTIRVVYLEAGVKDDPIKCRLVVRRLADAEFEALSYSWGYFIKPLPIEVDGKPFYITRNLYTALQGLRHPDRALCLWIDAVCINQHNDTEKSSQVSIMRDIYLKALKTRICLGAATTDTRLTFAFSTRLHDLTYTEREETWRESHPDHESRSVKREYRNILNHGWWSRTWTIQEAVISKVVVLQRGPEELPWDSFLDLLPFTELKRQKTTINFAQELQRLRVQARGLDSTASASLPQLVHAFRFQQATFGSDKIYALLGLLAPDQPVLTTPDYSKTPEHVFMEFTVACIEYSHDLTPLALAAGNAIQGVSWCRDWRILSDGHHPTVRLLNPHRPYSASGTFRLECKVDIQQSMLLLRGFAADEVLRVGDIGRRIPMVDKIYPSERLLLGWEGVAGRDSKVAFDRTISADGVNYDDDDLDWRQHSFWDSKSQETPKFKEYLAILRRAVENRRFFVTRQGSFGLGPWDVRKGDVVSILSGGSTPFLLRPCDVRGKAVEDRKCYNVVGEAYVDGLMYYDDVTIDQTDQKSLYWFDLI